MVVLHHLKYSRSHRVLWLLEELGVPYDIVRYDRDPQTFLAPPELQKVHPLGKSPVITDGERTVAETGNILEYLVDRYGEGRLRPAAHSEEFIDYRYFLHYAEGSLMPYLFMSVVFEKVRTAPVPFFVKPVTKMIARKTNAMVVLPNLGRHLDFLESELRKRPWFAGAELTAADVQMSYPVEAARARVGLGERTHLADWLARVEARPAYERALEKGGPVVPPKAAA